MSYKSAVICLLVFSQIISCSNLSEEQNPPDYVNSSISEHDAKNEDHDKNPTSLQKCQKLLKTHFLFSKYTTANKTYKTLAKYPLEDLCGKHRKRVLALLNGHSGRIGILVEEDDLDTSKIKEEAIIKGVKISLEKINPKYKAQFLVLRVQNNKNSIKKALAKLILHYKIGMLITWGQSKFMKRIQIWQERFDTPTIYINKSFKSVKENGKHSYFVFPNIENITNKVIHEMKLKGVRTLAMLVPEKYQDSDLIKSISESLEENGINLVFYETYDNGNSHSMDNACRKIFIIDRNLRYKEFQTLYRQEEEKATAAGYEVNPRMVFLPARVTFDAVFIPDDFRTVRYFVKLFKYYKSQKIPIIGTHEWRSDDLLDPEEPFLNGSSFVDYIGDYRSLPVVDKEYKYKSEEWESFEMDYNIMGYYAAFIGQMAIAKSNHDKNKINRVLSNLQINDKFIQNQKAFKNDAFNWPAFLFEITRNQFVLDHR